MAILLQNVIGLLHNATVITNCDDSVTKCNSYYKKRCLLQIATVHSDLSILRKILFSLGWLVC